MLQAQEHILLKPTDPTVELDQPAELWFTPEQKHCEQFTVPQGNSRPCITFLYWQCRSEQALQSTARSPHLSSTIFNNNYLEWFASNRAPGEPSSSVPGLEEHWYPAIQTALSKSPKWIVAKIVKHNSTKMRWGYAHVAARGGTLLCWNVFVNSQLPS